MVAVLARGLGSGVPTLHVNIYQHVNTLKNMPGFRNVLNALYELVKWAVLMHYQVVVVGDLQATLVDEHRWNYAEGGHLADGDNMTRDCFKAMGGTATVGSSEATFTAKSGEQSSVIDHIWKWPANLRDLDGGVVRLSDSRIDHALRWTSFECGDLGAVVDRDKTRVEFVPKIKLQDWKSQRGLVTAAGEAIEHSTFHPALSQSGEGSTDKDLASFLAAGKYVALLSECEKACERGEQRTPPAMLSEDDQRILWHRVQDHLREFKTVATGITGAT
mmetsp:Transcript_40976/g.83823  ORF Transcript_40976/g.83823 Transcript_40976/m.83823 type:complete len:275 (+) Transcript_40976:88-912(+)